MRDRFACGGCHTFDGAHGRVGPDLSRVGERRSPAYIRRMVSDPAGTVPGTIMPKVPMAGATRELIVAFLTRGRRDSGPAVQATGPDAGVDGRSALPREAAADGPALYARYCATCHGAQGGGDGPNARNLPVRPARHADAEYMSRRSDDRLFDAIYAGGYPLGRSVTMPAYGETLTRAEVWSLVRHLRALCRCSGPAWSRDGDRARVTKGPR
jgi:cytochrome c oxidase cbb3-type subunit 3